MQAPIQLHSYSAYSALCQHVGMSREEAGLKLMHLIEKVGQGVSDVSYTTFSHPQDRDVTVYVIPTSRHGEVKDALEEIFGVMDECSIQ